MGRRKSSAIRWYVGAGTQTSFTKLCTQVQAVYSASCRREGQGEVVETSVTFPGLPSSKYRPLVDKYLPLGAGSVFSFDCAGGRDGGQDLIRGVSLWSHLANVGDAKSLIIHPASTTHRQLGDDELRAAGVGPGTVRLSVGTESVEDLIWDLRQGFALVAATAGKKVTAS